MTAAFPVRCRRAGCVNSLPQGLAGEQLCLDHFLDEAFLRTDETLERARQGETLDPDDLEWLLSDALAIVKNLEEGANKVRQQHEKAAKAAGRRTRPKTGMS